MGNDLTSSLFLPLNHSMKEHAFCLKLLSLMCSSFIHVLESSKSCEVGNVLFLGNSVELKVERQGKNIVIAGLLWE
jgi:hypothetical protein